MAQDAFKVDQVQIEPGASGTRLINRATDGSLNFTDPSNPSGITLSKLAGLRNIGGILVVGKSGAGAQYTAVQDALDAIPSSSSSTNPYYVIIGPGVYAETLTLVRDGVTLIGYGATLAALETTPDGPAATHTLTIKADLGTVPKKVTFINLDINNIHTNFAALYVLGGAGSTVAQDNLLLQDCTLKATGAGLPLKAVAVNHIVLQGGSMMGSNAASLVLVQNCASFLAESIADIPAVQLVYDIGEVVPSEPSVGYKLNGCTWLGTGSALTPPVSTTLIGDGSLVIQNCSGGADCGFFGDHPVKVLGSELGALSIEDDVDVFLTGSTHGDVNAGSVGSGGTATLSEPIQTGTISFSGDTSKTVVFDTPTYDANYTVSVETDDEPSAWWVAGKSGTGFTLYFADVLTAGVTWTTYRVM